MIMQNSGLTMPCSRLTKYSRLMADDRRISDMESSKKNPEDAYGAAEKVAVELGLPPKGSRKNKFTFLMARSSSSNLVVEYTVSKRSAAFVGQIPFFLCGNVC